MRCMVSVVYWSLTVSPPAAWFDMKALGIDVPISAPQKAGQARHVRASDDE